MIEVTIRIATDADNPLSEQEQAVLTALAGSVPEATLTTAPVESVQAPAPTPAPRAARKARQTRSTRAAVLEDDKEPEPPADTNADEEVPGDPQEDDVLGGDAATLEQAVALATDAVSNGKTAKVKAALAAAGAPKVRDLEGDQIQVFVDEMNK